MGFTWDLGIGIWDLRTMRATNIAFTGIPVTDIKRARAFYEGVLGLKVSGEFGEGVWIEYEIGDDTLAITVRGGALISGHSTPATRMTMRSGWWCRCSCGVAVSR